MSEEKKFEEKDNLPGNGGNGKDKKSGKKWGIKNCRTNSPTYYTAYPDLVETVGKVSFAQLTGMPYKAVGNAADYGAYMWNQLAPSGFLADHLGTYLPGMMKVNFIPYYGVADGKTAAVNIASQQMYATIRSVNSGARNYEAVDLMEIEIAMDSIASNICLIKRILTLLNRYSVWNKYWPKSILQAMTATPLEELINDRYTYISKLNNIIHKFNKIAFPGAMSIMRRHSGLCKNVFSDDGVEKGQIYFYQPLVYYVYDWYAEGGGQVKAYAFPNDAPSMEQYFTILDTQLEALYTNEDVAVITGDIVKAFGDAVEKIAPLGLDEAIDIAFDEYSQWQIHNAITLPKLSSPWSFKIARDNMADAFTYYQSEGSLVSQPMITISRSDFNNDSEIVRRNTGTNAIDLPPKATTPTDIMYTTRLIPHYLVNAPRDTTDVNIQIISCGSEIIAEFKMYGFTRMDQGETVLNATLVYTDRGVYSTDPITMIQTVAAGALLSEMRWAPRINYYLNDSPSSLDPFSSPFAGSQWQTENIAVLEENNLNALHDAAILSLLKLEGNARR